MDRRVPRYHQPLPLDRSDTKPLPLHDMVQRAINRRSRSWRRLPPNCVEPWNALLLNIASDFQGDERFVVTALAPIIFLTRRRRSRGRVSEAAMLLAVLQVVNASRWNRRALCHAFGRGEEIFFLISARLGRRV
jgi:hypothetical protein